MKKIKLMTVLLFSMIVMIPSVHAIETGSANLEKDACVRFANTFVDIREQDGNSFYYKKCYWARCNSGQYGLINQTSPSGYRCLNGNSNPYVKISSDGCSSFKGACNKDNTWGNYCTNVTFVDCGRNANGTPYGTTTTAKVPTTTAAPTTTVKTTAKTTKATVKTTKKRTTIAPFTNETTVTTTTTAPTTTTTVPNNPNIKTILINGTDMKYKKSKGIYTIKVPVDVNEVTVDVELEQPTDTTTIDITGNKDMPEGDTEIKIEVTAQGGAKNIVTLKVKRYTNESNDCTLANIHIEDYDLDFEKNSYDYKLNIKKNTNSLDLQILPTDEMNATYEVTGNEKLVDGSKISVKVRAQDGTECFYTIKVKKSNNLWKYVVLIVLLVGALVFASITLYKYMKKSKGRYKYE